MRRAAKLGAKVVDTVPPKQNPVRPNGTATYVNLPAGDMPGPTKLISIPVLGGGHHRYVRVAGQEQPEEQHTTDRLPRQPDCTMPALSPRPRKH